MTRNYVIAVGVALLLPGIVNAHPGAHWKHEKKIERHERKAEHHYQKARHHQAKARKSARNARRDYARETYYGRVLSVQPVYEQHHGRHTSHSCVQWSEEYNPGHSTWAPTIVGSVIGGAIGYHLGEDHGDPEVATIAGGLLGAAAGHGIGSQTYKAKHIRVTGACRPYANTRRDTRRVEYLVTYRYNGRIYREHMDYDPGEWVRLNVEASPA